MNKLQKEAKREADRQLRERSYKRDADNRVIVHMTVKDDEDFLSAFSKNETPVISTDVADFIENSTSFILPKELLTLQIHSSCIDEQEKVIYEKAVREFYTQKYIANEQELRRNKLTARVLFFVGILLLIWEFVLEYRIGGRIGAEVLDIAAWVFLWESVDISMFGNKLLRIKRDRYLAYLCMKIEYINA